MYGHKNMKNVIKTSTNSSSYNVSIGEEFLNSSHLKKFLTRREVLLVVDSNIPKDQVGKVLKEIKNTKPLAFKKIDLKCSEETKNFKSIEKIHNLLINLNFSRECVLVSIGGGILSDITGFAASTYQRGVDFLLIPTTLLSQVDASVGGKTAINHAKAKNMIGSFHQPIEVIISDSFLDSLPKKEIGSGIVEMIKHGLILDANYFIWLEKNISKILILDKSVLLESISRSVEIKSEIVSKDEKEKGVRALLNFGHTFGHGLEVLGNYNTYNHGEAVALGILCAIKLSEENQNLDTNLLPRVKKLFAACKIGIELKEDINANELLDSMQQDKKKKGNDLTFITLKKIGKAKKVSKIAENSILKAVKEAF